MEISETKSMQSIEARSIASYGSGGNNPLHNQQFIPATKDNVKVVIRVRPLNDREKNSGGSKKCVSVENQTTVILDAKPDYKVFNFDFVGNEDLEQDTVFNQIARPIADCCLEGYNGSIFAYGQTGAGKTFTIQGPSILQNGEEQIMCSLRKEAGSEYDKRGLMARSFEYIFDCLINAKQNAESSNGESNFEYLVRCSYLEIYNEQIMDLLEPTSINLHIREDIKKGVYVEGLQEEVVQNALDMMDLIVRGGKNRHVGSTSMNKESSRSHSVLTTIIETKSMKESGGVWNIKTSRFHIIDLAGSERQKYTNAIGDRLKEAGMINKSLSALGNVINSLVDISEGKNRHVHYRDSKLTFLLRDSLGGNSKTVIIANVSPSTSCYGETLSTLKFAQRAKLIRNKAVINEDSSGTISLLKKEIARLKQDLAEYEQRSQINNTQCAFCKNNLNGEQVHEEDDMDDEMLLDSSNLENSMLLKSVILDKDDNAISSTQPGILNEAIIKKFKHQKCELQNMRKRVVYLEGLLSANLDNLTSQQKFHDQEQTKNQQQIKKLQQAVDSYEKQCARDKMIIKFREDRITKLEQGQPVTADDKQKQINDLKKEIAMWKDAVDHNAQAAKLFAEKADLMNKMEQMQKELKQTPDSMSAQMRSLNELNEGLNEYLKLYCEESKKEVESELSKVKLDYSERIEELNSKLDQSLKLEQDLIEKHQNEEKEWKSHGDSLKLEIERLNTEYLKEKEEIERLNKEAFNKIKQEIEAICENKTEQEQESQLLRVQLIEKERELEREVENKEERQKYYQNKEAELVSQLNHLQSNIAQLEDQSQRDRENAKVEVDELNQQIDQERKQMSSRLKHEVEQWEKKMKDMERQMLAEQSEKEMVQEQCETMTVRIKSLEDQNETVQSSLMYKEEEVNEITRQIKTKETELLELQAQANEIQSLNTDKDQQLQQLQCRINELIEERDRLVQELEQSRNDCAMLRQALEEIKCEIDQITQDKLILEQSLQQSQAIIQQLSATLQETESSLQEKQSTIEQLTQQLQDQVKSNQTLVEQCNELQESVQGLENQIQIDRKLYEDQQNNVIQKYEESLQQLNKEMTQFALNKDNELMKLQTALEQDSTNQQKLIARYETAISDLRQQIELQQNEYNQQVAQVTKSYEDKIGEINQEMKNKDTQHKDKIKFIQDHNIKELEQIQEAHNLQITLLTQEQEQNLSQIKEQYEDKITSIIHDHTQQLQVFEVTTQEQSKTLEQSVQILHQESQQQVQALVFKHQEVEAQLSLKLEQQQQSFAQEQLAAKLLQQKIEQSFLDKLQELRSEKDLEQQKVQEEKEKEIEVIMSQTQQESKDLLNQINDLQVQVEQYKEQICELQSQFQKQNESSEKSKQDLKETMTIKEQQYQQSIQEIMKQKEEEFNHKQEEIEKVHEQEKQSYESKISSLQDELDNQVTTLLSSRSQSEESYNLKIKAQQSLLSQRESELTEQKSQLNETIFKLENELQGHIKTIQDIQNKYQQLSQDKQTQIEQLQSQIQSQQSELNNLVSLQQEERQQNKQLSQQLVESIAQVDELRQQSSQQQQQLDSIVQVQQEERQQNRDISVELQDAQQQLLVFQEKYTQITMERNQLVVEYQQIQEQDDAKIEQIEQLQVQQQQLVKDLDQQKRMLDDTLAQLNNDHVKKYQELQSQYSSQQLVVQQEIETYKNHCKELNQQIAKWKQRSEEQNEMLNKSKDTITGMVQKENELMKELEKKINELRDHQEKWKKRVQEARDEKEQMKKEWERMKKENENLRELVKLKDRQIEDQLNQEEKERDHLEKLQKENKDLRNQVTKREFEMKEVVRTLKFYSEEKTRLEKELEKLHRENDQLIGHKNPSQKIQHHLKIKEENNKLREENFKLQEELRRKTEVLVKSGVSKELTQMGSLTSLQQEDPAATTWKEDMKKLKKENMTYQETINRLVDHILSQPGLMKVLGISDDVNEKIQHQTGSSKVKNAMEIISLFSNVIQTKERDLKELQREKKKVECKLDIVEKEKNLCKQQLELMQHSSSTGSSFMQPTTNSFLHSSKSPTHIHQQQYGQQDVDFKIMGHPSVQQRAEGIQSQDKSNHSSDFMGGIPKSTPSPIYNFKQVQKEKENMNSKKDLFGDKRSGSSRRTAYLNSNTMKQ